MLRRTSRLGLRGRIALAFLVTSVLTMAVLFAAALGAGLVQQTLSSDDGPAQVAQTARAYALQFATQPTGDLSPSHPLPIGVATDPQQRTTRDAEDGGADVLIVPYITGPLPDPRRPPTVALVTDRRGDVVATSFPARYPVGRNLAGLVPSTGAALDRALDHRATTVPGDDVDWAVAPIERDGSVIGAVYVRARTVDSADLFGSAIALFGGALGWTILIAPFAALFGVLTMRGTIRRLRRLVDAFQAVGGGDFSRRVTPHGRDEVGELQRQFNAMASELEGAVTAERELSAGNARLEERGRIARDLHDSMSQHLFALRMRLAGLAERHRADPALRPQLEELQASTELVIRQMRALLLELRPPSLEGLDLEVGLHELAATYGTRLGIAVDARVAPPPAVPAGVQETLLYIAQEALANAARHSGAGRIEVTLAAPGGGIELRVADDGRGFEPGEARGMGLQIAAERAREIGAELDVRSGPGRGTEVVASIAASHFRGSAIRSQG